MEHTSQSFAFVKLAMDLNNEGLLPKIKPLTSLALNAISVACGVEPTFQYFKLSSAVACLLANVHLHICSTNPLSSEFKHRYLYASISQHELDAKLATLSQKLSRYAKRKNKDSTVDPNQIYRELSSFSINLRREQYDLYKEK